MEENAGKLGKTESPDFPAEIVLQCGKGTVSESKKAEKVWNRKAETVRSEWKEGLTLKTLLKTFGIVSRETIKENSGKIRKNCRSGFQKRIFTGTGEPVLSLILEARRNIPVSRIKEGQSYSRQGMRKHLDSRTKNGEEILKEKSGGKKKQKGQLIEGLSLF